MRQREEEMGEKEMGEEETEGGRGEGRERWGERDGEEETREGGDKGRRRQGEEAAAHRLFTRKAYSSPFLLSQFHTPQTPSLLYYPDPQLLPLPQKLHQQAPPLTLFSELL